MKCQFNDNNMRRQVELTWPRATFNYGWSGNGRFLLYFVCCGSRARQSATRTRLSFRRYLHSRCWPDRLRTRYSKSENIIEYLSKQCHLLTHLWFAWLASWPAFVGYPSAGYRVAMQYSSSGCRAENCSFHRLAWWWPASAFLW